MPIEYEILRVWIPVSLCVAAFFSTLFPVLYMFSAWYKTSLGRVLMFQALAFAAAIDVTLLFQFWRPTLAVALVVNTVVFSTIAVSTALLSILLWRWNFAKGRWKLAREARRRTHIKPSIKTRNKRSKPNGS